MKEKLQNKIDEVIENILAKDAKKITYNEYYILDNKLSNLKYEEEQETRRGELAEMMAKTFSYGIGSPPSKLPKGEIKDE